MLKIVRLYNKNRKTIWLWLIIAIFCIAIVNLIQYAYTEQSRKLAEKAANQTITLEEKENPSEVVDYNEAAQSITAGGAVEEDVKDEVQGVLEQFIKYVTNKQIEQAYSLLTEDCKAILYPTLEGFEQKYCQDLYEKIYDFQSWSSTDNTYVYQVRFYESDIKQGTDGVVCVKAWVTNKSGKKTSEKAIYDFAFAGKSNLGSFTARIVPKSNTNYCIGISGKNNGTSLDPKGTATRAEAAAMINNYVVNVK